MADKSYRLRVWARQILLQTSGDVNAALPHLDRQIIEADDADRDLSRVRAAGALEQQPDRS
jgi:hypothetical protein